MCDLYFNHEEDKKVSIPWNMPIFPFEKHIFVGLDFLKCYTDVSQTDFYWSLTPVAKAKETHFTFLATT